MKESEGSSSNPTRRSAGLSDPRIPSAEAEGEPPVGLLVETEYYHRVREVISLIVVQNSKGVLSKSCSENI